MKSREHRSGLFTVRLLPAIYRLRIVSCFLCPTGICFDGKRPSVFEKLA
jgi:hypothetical protein